jgi:hypothetical protein
VNPTLQADLGGAALPGLLAATLYLPKMQIVRTPAQIFRQLSFGKGASNRLTDAGVVDVAVHHVGDFVAAHTPPQLAGRFANHVKVVSARGEKLLQVAPRRRIAGHRTVKNRFTPPGLALVAG